MPVTEVDVKRSEGLGGDVRRTSTETRKVDERDLPPQSTELVVSDHLVSMNRFGLLVKPRTPTTVLVFTFPLRKDFV